jgi:hypothetical protein
MLSQQQRGSVAGNGIVNRPASVTVSYLNGLTRVTLASTSFTYDQGTPTPTTNTPQHIAISGSRGNLTTLTTSTSSSASLSKTFTYYDTGTPNVATDVNGGQTTYVYGTATQGNTMISCGNSLPTTIDEPLSLTRSITWNCTGGVATQVADENGNNVTSNYTDPDFWRPSSIVDQMMNQATITYHGQYLQAGAIYTDIQVEDCQFNRQCNLTTRIQTSKAPTTVQRCFPLTAESSQIWFWSEIGKSGTPRGVLHFVVPGERHYSPLSRQGPSGFRSTTLAQGSRTQCPPTVDLLCPRTAMGTLGRDCGRRIPGGDGTHEETEDPSSVHDRTELFHRVLPQALPARPRSYRPAQVLCLPA